MAKLKALVLAKVMSKEDDRINVHTSNDLSKAAEQLLNKPWYTKQVILISLEEITQNQSY